MIATAIVGCSGYTGQETLDRVLAHPGLEIVALGSDTYAGRTASAFDVRLNGSLPAFVPNDEALASDAELVLLCLDHAEAAAVEPRPLRSSSTSPGRTGSWTRRRRTSGTAWRRARGRTGSRSSTRRPAR